MLSYQHSFHAGNFADVLKHLIVQRIALYLRQKTAPFSLFDTHAGAGLYALHQGQAQKNREFDSGIGRLWQRQDLPPLLTEYVSLIHSFNADKQLTHYPGSPLILQHYLRAKDRLFLCELHPNEFKLLQRHTKVDRHIQLQQTDGLPAVYRLLPPAERRGLILIDPSYEVKSDYQLVVQSLKQMQQRFAQGIYALWYPVVERARTNQLEQALRHSGMRNLQLFELGIAADTLEHGMTASGLIVINPPWTLMGDMQAVLPYLAQQLGVEGMGYFRAEQLVAE